MPLILHVPARLPCPERVEARVNNRQIMRTIFDILQIRFMRRFGQLRVGLSFVTQEKKVTEME